MKVLFFSRDYTTHDRRFLQKLSESRHDVWFLRLQNDGIRYETRPLPERVRLVKWPGGCHRADTLESWLSLMPAFEATLEDIKPDIVHAGPVQSCGLMTALSGFHPFVLMSWGSDMLVDADRSDLWRWMTCYALRHSDIFVCDCQAVRDKARDLTGYRDERIVQFPWGVDANIYTPGGEGIDLRSQPGWEDAFILISTRSLEPLYGIETLLDAFRQAVAQRKRLRLALLGEGSLKPAIEDFISRHGLSEYVYRPGVIPQSRLPDYFRAADLYISCCLSDGSSVSLLEAMATGLPVIVTDAHGNREWVGPDNGWLAPAKDADANAQAILIAEGMEASQRENMRAANRKVVEQRADWNLNFDKLLKAYDEIEAHLPVSRK
jgi:glycosyltransferase involved in cell wall biosynthesis